MRTHPSLKKSFSLALLFICSFLFFFLLLSHSGLQKDIARAENAEPVTVQLHYGDGSVYDGEAISGTIRNGIGTYSWSAGNSDADIAYYTGQWENGNMAGTGELVLPGIGIYKGEFVNNKRQGRGSFIWTYNGEPETGAPVSFDGEWDNDKIGSQGTLILAGLGTYSGSFSKQKRSGHGVFTWNDGSEYIGSWSNDQITGEGYYTLPDGTILSGNFQKGLLSSGTITYAVENGTAVRTITSGKAQPSVKVTYNDGTIIEGKTKNTDFVGIVNISYANGDHYTGTIQNGLKQGKGTYIWQNGAHYIGEWNNDLMSGTGKYYYGESEKDTYLSGGFLNGKPNGILTYVSENKLKYRTVWKNGSVSSITYMK